MNKKLLISSLGLAMLLGAGALTASAVSADDATFPPLVERLAERFNLNQDEVQSFFEEQKEEHHRLMMQNKEEKLNQAVSDGVLTEEQKQALLDRWEEMKAHREEHHQEMQQWFEEQGIDPEKLHTYLGFGHRGFGHWHAK